MFSWESSGFTEDKDFCCWQWLAGSELEKTQMTHSILVLSFSAGRTAALWEEVGGAAVGDASSPMQQTKGDLDIIIDQASMKKVNCPVEVKWFCRSEAWSFHTNWTHQGRHNKSNAQNQSPSPGWHWLPAWWPFTRMALVAMVDSTWRVVKHTLNGDGCSSRNEMLPNLTLFHAQQVAVRHQCPKRLTKRQRKPIAVAKSSFGLAKEEEP